MTYLILATKVIENKCLVSKIGVSHKPIVALEDIMYFKTYYHHRNNSF